MSTSTPPPMPSAAGPKRASSPGPVPLRAPAAFAPVLPAPAASSVPSAPSVQRAAKAAPAPAAAPSVTRLHTPTPPALPGPPATVQRAGVSTGLKSLWKKAVGPSASRTPGPPPAPTPGPPPPYDPGPPPPYDAGQPPPYDPAQPPPYSLHDPHPGGRGPHAGQFDPRALTDGQIDELTHRLLGPLTRLLRTELRMDRERIGRLRDPRS
ncbi:extensin [Streptomyces sp. NPDC088106]|uniref:extensin n=1 Tax=Streptomyces sp. NPDC088106 TaxID=3154867 RepID=UPI00342B9FE3